MKIYNSSYYDNIACAKDAEANSWQYNTIVNIACDSKADYKEICTYLKNNEDCIDYVNNDGVMEVWGNIGNAEYRVHVYIIDHDNNRF